MVILHRWVVVDGVEHLDQKLWTGVRVKVPSDNGAPEGAMA